MQAEGAPAVSRSGLHGLLLGPVVSEALREVRKPGPPAPPLPSPTRPPSLPSTHPPTPGPFRSLPAFLPLPPRTAPPSRGTRFPHAFRGARELTRRRDKGTVSVALWAPGDGKTPPVRGPCAPLSPGDWCGGDHSPRPRRKHCRAARRREELLGGLPFARRAPRPKPWKEVP